MSRSRTYDDEGGQSLRHVPHDKPCRACTDFKTFLKSKGKESSSSEAGQREQQCPLDRNELGRNTWSLLHTIAAYYPSTPSPSQQSDMKSYLSIFSRIYPCDECAADLRQDLKEMPPRVENRTELSQWMCRLHNKVNVKLGKPEFDCSKVDERWLDGWKDGSCD
jgi:FAD-linked sulfhydryl oxidase